MQNNYRLAAVGVAGCLALASVAVAKPPHPSHPAHPNTPSNSGKSGSKGKKCGTHEVAYVASGPLLTWAGVAGAGGTFTGSVTFTVKHANHHAASLKGTALDVPLTTMMKVRLGQGVTTPSTQDWVKVVGKITAVAKTCTNQSGAGVVTVRKVFILMQH
jgi:hypothetical protein